MKAADLIPIELKEFLAAHGGTRIDFEPGALPGMEVKHVEFFSLDSLPQSSFSICTYEYYLNHDEPGDDPEQRYVIEGIDLIRGCDNYDPKGILTYFPLLGEFGFWDPDHHTISLFPNVGWAVIEKSLPQFVNSQWYQDLAEQALLRPWADGRCSEIQALPD